MITRFEQILDAVADHPMCTVAISVAEHKSVLEAAKDAFDKNIARPLLFGRSSVIEPMADEVELTLTGDEIVDIEYPLDAAREAARAVREGRADLLMKGHIHTDDFLRSVLDKETGLRAGHIMSHVFVLETLGRGKLTFVTDGAMNIPLDLVTKADIIMNAVYLSRCFGIKRPRVGILAATEVVNPAMPATVDAAALNIMQKRHQFPDCIVDGPFALDNAVSEIAAEVKGLTGDVAGKCDILVTPNIEAGNILSKAFTFMAGGRVAGVLVGAAAPVVLTSRADNAEAKLFSIATGVLMASICRSEQCKIGKVHF